jgi:hypothetical protein
LLNLHILVYDLTPCASLSSIEPAREKAKAETTSIFKGFEAYLSGRRRPGHTLKANQVKGRLDLAQKNKHSNLVETRLGRLMKPLLKTKDLPFLPKITKSFIFIAASNNLPSRVESLLRAVWGKEKP